MAVDFTEYVTKLQEESLEAVKQAQDVSLVALASLREIASSVPGMGQIPVAENFPSTAKLVEMGFGFASQLLELQKQYTLKAADIIAPRQKNGAA